MTHRIITRMESLSVSASSGVNTLLGQIKSQWVWLLGILVIAGWTRLVNLQLLPPFIDEVGGIDLAKRYDYYPLYQRVALGFNVLGSVLVYPTAQWAPAPLYATRFLVALSGILTTLGVFLVAHRLGGRGTAILASFMWAAMPFITFHDRLALFDPLVSCLMVWAIFFLWSSINGNKWIEGLFAGLLLGLAIITKIYAAVGIVWFILLALVILESKNPKNYSKTLLAIVIGIALPAVVIFILIAPDFHMFLQSVQGNTNQFIGTSVDRQALLVKNLTELIDWFATYNSVPFGIYFLVAMLLVAWRPSRIKLVLLLSFLFSVLANILTFQEWFPRYFIPNLVPLVILAALGSSEWLGQLARRSLRKPRDVWIAAMGSILIGALFIFSVSAWGSANLLLQTNPYEVRIPYIDQFQYFYGWPSGTGVEETIRFLNTLTDRSGEKTIVFTAGYGTHGFWSFPLLMKDNPNVEFQRVGSYGICSTQDLVQIAKVASTQRTLILLEPPIYVLPPKLFSLIAPPPLLVFDFRRPKAEGGFQLYELAPSTHVELSPEEQEMLRNSGGK